MRHHSKGHSPTGGFHWGLLSVLAVAQLMVILDISAVNVALPNLARDLNIDGTSIGWAISSYSLLFGSLLLLGGRAADLLGRRRVVLVGLFAFTVSSLVSASAGSATAVFIARAGQGIGAALLSPAALSIIVNAFDGPDRARALGLWGAVGGAGAAIGVLLAGVLTAIADWRAIFYINVPVGVVLGVLIWRIVPADTARPRWRGLDVRGAIVGTLSLGAIVYSISQAATMGASAAVAAVVGVFGLVAFVALERGAAQPLLRIERLADGAVGGGFGLMLVAAGVLFGTFLLSSLYLQNVLGVGPLETGLAFLPLAVASGGGAHLASQLTGRFGVRTTMASGFAVAGAGLLLLARVQDGGSYLTDVLPGIVVAGFGIGLVLVSVALAVLTGAREDEAGMLSGLNSTGHEIGGTLGIGVPVSIASATAGGPTSAAGIGAAYLRRRRCFTPPPWRRVGVSPPLQVVINMRLPPAELRRRHRRVLAAIQPLIERGQRSGAFRSDVPASWHLSMTLALVHAATEEVRSRRPSDAEVEAALTPSVLGALAGPRGQSGASMPGPIASGVRRR